MSIVTGPFRAGVAACALSIGIVSTMSPASARNIIALPSGSLEHSLNALSRQHGVQILYDQALLRGKNAPAIRGAASVEAALIRLLRGSGLTYRKQGRTFLVVGGKAVAGAKPVRTSAHAAVTAAVAPVADDAAGHRPDIIVTGERAVDQSNIARKYEKDEIYDSVNVDDAGQLPDFNIPEAMRRIAGVSAIYDEDEGQFMTARGLPVSYNLTTFDDMVVATIGGYGDGSRNINMQAIPSTALKRLEVYKSHMSDQDLGWVGAHFNTDTRSAFDAKGLYLIARGKLNYFTANDTPTAVPVGSHNSDNTLGYQTDLTMSNHFGSDDQFGFVLGASYYYKNRHQYKTQYNNLAYLGEDADGDGVGDIVAPRELRAYAYTNAIKRVGVVAKLEWKPDPMSYLAWTGALYTMNESENRFMHGIRGISESNMTVTDATSGTFKKGYGEIQAAYFPNNRRQISSKLHGDHRFDNDGTLSFDLGYSQHRLKDNAFPDVSIRTLTNISGTYDTSGTFWRLVPDAASNAAWYSAPSYVNVTSNDIRSRHSEERVIDFKADYDWHTRGEPGLGFKTGIKITDLYRTRDDGRIRGMRGTDTGITDYDFAYLSDFEIDGRTGQPLLMLDYQRWQQVMGRVEDVNSSYEYDRKDDSAYGETIKAGYAMVTYSSDRFKLAAGLRYEDVNVRGWYNAVTEASPHDLYSRQNIKGGYNSLNPSVSLRYAPVDNLRVKLAFSQTLGRPNPDQVAKSGESVSFDANDELTSATRGNPDLKPRRSSNFDATLEYYFSGRKNLIMLGGFYKDIQDEIVTRTSMMDIVYDGILYENVRVKQPQNAENAKVWGAEAQIVLSDLSFLPRPLDRLGFNANALITGAQMQYNDGLKLDFLPYQSKFVANVAVSYDWTNRLETRVAYNFLGGYQDGVSLNSDETATNIKSQTRWTNWETIDAKLQYKVTDKLRLELEAKNLTNANRRKMQGPGFRYIYEENEFGRSFFLGASYRF
ncbi:MAG: TonB-dependent receptor [Sphingomonadales bacterium]|nr:MAG: TonB-dependent receptor [Sphingomonadales bacterium]TNF04150.1 MAG: TonB-dependent receptor [Sphingomonadales bacterium]